MPEDPAHGAKRNDPEGELLKLGHPRGTLAILLVYGALFALGWLLLYYGEFLPRG